VSPSPDLVWQPSFLATDEDVGIDLTFAALRRIDLDDRSWVDHAPGWVRGSDRVFELVLESRDWGQRSRRMYDQRVREPRLTAPWNAGSGEPLEPPVLEEIRRVLSERYGRRFDSVGFNLYRDGRDSVAWHGDTIGRGSTEDTMVAIVSVGNPRPLLLRPRRGGSGTLRYELGHGDLLVMGGSCQRTWEHAVPKTARPAGPRISIQFRPRGVR